MKSERKIFKVKNTGNDSSAILYDAQNKPQTIRVGETVSMELPVKFAARIHKMSLNGGNLRLINESDAVMKPKQEEYRDRGGKLVDGPLPGASAPVSRATDDDLKPEVEDVIHPEIKTATQLLAAQQDGEPLGWPQFLAVSRRIIGSDDMPKPPTKVKILAALAKLSKKD